MRIAIAFALIALLAGAWSQASESMRTTIWLVFKHAIGPVLIALAAIACLVYTVTQANLAIFF